MKAEDLLYKLYYKDNNFDGINALYLKAKEINKEIKKDDVKKWLKKQSVAQQTYNKPFKKSYLPIYSEITNSFQIDLTFLPKYKKENDENYILFTAININTRFVYAYYSKNRKNENLLDFLKLLENETIINYISGDLEFKRDILTDFLDDNEIEYDFYKADSHKLGIINRFHRTLKEKLEKYFIANNTLRWIDVIDKIIKNYNNTYHTGIKATPFNVNSLVELDILEEKRNKTKEIKDKEEKYYIGDLVRIKNKKDNIFEKNKQNFSALLYVITKVFKNSVKVKIYNKNDEKEETIKKSNLLKVNEVENNKDIENLVKRTIKEYNINRKIKKEDLINEPTKSRLRINPKKKIISDL